MKALVTGGAGFIGSHVCDRLLTEGIDVVVLDDLSTGRIEQVPSGAGFYQLDLLSPWLPSVLREERPDAVLHHAAQASVRVSVAKPNFDAEVNVLGTIRLLEAAVAAGVQRVVFASSGGAVYGDTTVLPTPEDTPARPVSPYGAAKLSAEHYLHYYHAVHGLSYAALRYANVYGPRQDPHGEAGVVAIFAQRLLAGQPAIIFGDGRQTRDYVYVEDVADANLRALRSAVVGAFNIGTGHETSVLDLFQRLSRLTGATVPAQHIAPKAGEQRRSCVAIGRAAQDLDWRPTLGLEDGLCRTVKFFRAAGGHA